MHKIDLMIIGAQKAGTTAIKNYLSEHPEILCHTRTEFAYFLDKEAYPKGFEESFKFYFDADKYTPGKKIVAKYASMAQSEEAIKRLYEHNPDCKLVFILRNPVERAYSSYNMEKSRGLLKRDFNEVADIIKKEQYQDQMFRLLIKLGLYADQLQYIYKYFDQNQVKLFLYEDLSQNTKGICREIFEWLALKNTEFIPDFSKKHNETSVAKSETLSGLIRKMKRNQNPVKRILKAALPGKVFLKIAGMVESLNSSNKRPDPMDQSTRLFLKSYYEKPNEELSKMTGLNLDRWN
jgi:hypothetical protein